MCMNAGTVEKREALGKQCCAFNKSDGKPEDRDFRQRPIVSQHKGQNAVLWAAFRCTC